MFRIHDEKGPASGLMWPLIRIISKAKGAEIIHE